MTDVEVQILAIEAQWWKHPGAKNQAVRELLGLSMTRYMQIVNRLIDTEAALAFDPLTVGRLRRLRDRGLVGRRVAEAG